MKKYLTFTIIISMFFLTSCSNNESASTFKSVDNLNNVKDDIAEIDKNIEEENSKVVDDIIKNDKKGNSEIKISSVKADDVVTSPVKIEGEASGSVENLTVELRNLNHESLVKELARVQADGSFVINLHFQFNNTKEGFIAVYEDENNVIEIPVKFK